MTKNLALGGEKERKEVGPCYYHYRPGDVVLTVYGPGVIVRTRRTTGGGGGGDSTVDDQEDHDATTPPRAAAETTALSAPPPSSPPSSFVDDDTATRMLVVRLWRIPGKSVGSSAIAFLHPTALVAPFKKCLLPAAPGMITTLKAEDSTEEEEAQEGTNPPKLPPGKKRRVLVYNYSSSRQTYLVAMLPDENDKNENEHSAGGGGFLGTDPTGDSQTSSSIADRALALVTTGISPTARRSSDAYFGGGAFDRGVAAEPSMLVEVPADRLEASSCSKFYPVLDALLDRAERTAQAATRVLSEDSTQDFIRSADALIGEKVRLLTQDVSCDDPEEETLTSSATASMEALSKDVTARVESLIPEAEESARHVLQLVKDKELTELLETCKARLEQLMTADLLTDATRSALELSGIRIAPSTASSKNDGGLAESVELSRRAALAAVNELLRKAQVDPADLEKARHDVTEQFASAFDSIAQAASSDRNLQGLFESLQDKTAEWQRITGRLMQTRSANLFLEGATRLRARALALLKDSQLNWAGEVGSVLTKSFTEGDAALARLKSIELGEAVKNRLVEAIQVRSESLGGLDGIIAGALSSVQAQTASALSSPPLMRNWLTEMRDRSSTVTTEAHETLLTVLSSRSQYRDVALLRIEAVLVNLERQLGDTLSPDELAAIVSGEGGTAQLFEPIAQRAMKQIESQLDVAEEKVTDPTALEVLRRVRKIMSGQLTIDSVMDELVSILNDDKVVAAGESLVQQSEHVLDVIEGASGNQAVSDALKLAERAGITKDAVMKEIEKLDVNDLLDTAGSAVTDERSRRKLLSQATDTALDFLLRILPSMPVPPFEGVNEGLVYNISNLSMEGFKVRKEDIQIELAGMRATRRKSSLYVSDICSNDDPFNGHSGHSKGSIMDVSFDVEELHARVKATELLIIDIRNISAILENAMYSFEQTYMPYLKGQGMANVRLSGGAIRLQFELRKKRVAEGNGQSSTSACVWEPVLCLHDRTCTISDVELTLHGQGSLNWIINKLASIFKGPLRDYVVRTIVNVLTGRSGWILERLNSVLGPYWDLILRTAQLDMSNLVEADETVVMNETSSTDRTFVELVWRDRLPLGMNLLMNDESGLLKVVDFPRGSQARAVCEKRGLDPEIFKGSTVVGVNGAEYDDQDDLFEALKDPGRPKTVRFELADTEDAERIRRFVEGGDNKQDESGAPSEEDERQFRLRDVEFTQPGELGLEFADAPDSAGLVVRRFLGGPGGTVLAAERSGRVRAGDLLVKINGQMVISLGGAESGSGSARAIERLQSEGRSRPLTLTFAEPYLFRQTIDINMVSSLHEGRDGGPQELVLEELVVKETGAKRVVLKGFEDVSGSAESSGIMIGDHLVFVNGMPVGAGCRWLGVSPPPTLAEIHAMMAHDKAYPMGLTFARPRRQRDAASRWTNPSRDRMFRDDEAETMCVTFERPSQLGCVFDETRVHDVVVADFRAVPGVFQRALGPYLRPKFPLSFDSVNGQFVPSYATKDMVRSAIQRSWKSEGHVDVCLCDDTNRRWIHAVAQASLAASP